MAALVKPVEEPHPRANDVSLVSIEQAMKEGNASFEEQSTINEDVRFFVFTHKAINSVPLPTEQKQIYYRDELTPYLHLSVTRKGCKSFVYYRNMGGEPKRVLLGYYPAMTLVQARDEVAFINQQIGKSKSTERKLAILDAAAQSNEGKWAIVTHSNELNESTQDDSAVDDTDVESIEVSDEPSVDTGTDKYSGNRKTIVTYNSHDYWRQVRSELTKESIARAPDSKRFGQLFDLANQQFRQEDLEIRVPLEPKCFSAIIFIIAVFKAVLKKMESLTTENEKLSKQVAMLKKINASCSSSDIQKLELNKEYLNGWRDGAREVLAAHQSPTDKL